MARPAQTTPSQLAHQLTLPPQLLNWQMTLPGALMTHLKTTLPLIWSQMAKQGDVPGFP